jgi:hypothetical protein
MYSQFLQENQVNQISVGSVSENDMDKDMINRIREELYSSRKKEKISTKDLGLYKRQQKRKGGETRLFYVNLKDDFCPSKFSKATEADAARNEP